MSDLLRGSLGDSQYSDNGSNSYQHGHYGLLSGNYMNERDSAFETHPELSLPTPFFVHHLTRIDMPPRLIPPLTHTTPLEQPRCALR